jgi:predicted transcriptional regulator
MKKTVADIMTRSVPKVDLAEKIGAIRWRGAPVAAVVRNGTVCGYIARWLDDLPTYASVHEVMATPPVLLSPDTDIDSAFKTMLEENASYAFVIANGKLLGYVRMERVMWERKRTTLSLKERLKKLDKLAGSIDEETAEVFYEVLRRSRQWG